MIPTLLLRGNLVEASPLQSQENLDRYTPIDYIIEWFTKRMSMTGVSNRVLFVKAETASGKSTVIPAAIYRSILRTGGTLICTQPRTLTTIRNVYEILKHNSDTLRLGENIGWSTRYDKTHTARGILSATVGTLAMQMRSLTDAEIKSMYKFILIDEVHERDIQTDLTIGFLRGLVERNATAHDCPFVVLMSATYDPTEMLQFFGLAAGNNHGASENVIWCRGKESVRDELWDWNSGRIISQYTRGAVDAVEHAVRKDPTATTDILVFLPGRREFDATRGWLAKLNKKLHGEGLPVFAVLSIDADAQREENVDYRRLDIPAEKIKVVVGGETLRAGRKVILSTNVAETGLTLENLWAVVDSGYNRTSEYNPYTNTYGLVTRPVTVSRVIQRMGRVARKFPGVFYPLYPKYVLSKLQTQQYPQILLSDATQCLLDLAREQLLHGGKTQLDNVPLPTLPAQDCIAVAKSKLYRMGLISVDGVMPEFVSEFISADTLERKILAYERYGSGGGYSLSALGLLASYGYATPESARMILAGFSYGCSLLDLCTIAAYLASDNLAPRGGSINWDVIYRDGFGKVPHARSLIQDEFIDSCVLLSAISSAISGPRAGFLRRLTAYCQSANLAFSSVVEFLRAREELIETLLQLSVNLFAYEHRRLVDSPSADLMNRVVLLKYCIYDGYRYNLVVGGGKDGFYSRGVHVHTKAEYAHTAFVYCNLKAKYLRETSIYATVPDKISVMSGYVHIDGEFVWS